MPCPFRYDVVLVPNAFAGLFIYPAPAAEKKGYTSVPQWEVIYL